MGRHNKPDSIQHSESKDGIGIAIEIATGGLFEAPVNYKTEVTGPNGATYTGHGHSRAEADLDAGERYAEGRSDKK